MEKNYYPSALRPILTSLACCVLLVAALLVDPSPSDARKRKKKPRLEPGFQIASITPQSAPAGQASSITLTASGKRGRVLLERLNARGKRLSTIGRLNDDGADGDETAGDGLYTIRFDLNESAPGSVTLRLKSALRAKTATSVASISVLGPTDELVALASSLQGPAEIDFDDPRPIALDPATAERLDQLVRAAFGSEPGVFVLGRPAVLPARAAPATTDLDLSKFTANAQAKARAELVLKGLKELGFDTKALKKALDISILVREGAQAGGLVLPKAREVQALTVNRNTRLGSSILPYKDDSGRDLKLYSRGDADTIVLSGPRMDSLLGDPVFDPKSGQLSPGMITLVHELYHVAGFELGCFPADGDDESFVLKLETIVRDKIDSLRKAAAGKDNSAEEGSIVCTLTEIEESGSKEDASDEQKQAAQCLPKLGFEVPKNVQLSADPGLVTFTAMQGCSASPSRLNVKVKARRPICFRAKARAPKPFDFQALVTKKSTDGNIEISAAATDLEGNALPVGNYSGFVDISSISSPIAINVTVGLSVTKRAGQAGSSAQDDPSCPPFTPTPTATPTLSPCQSGSYKVKQVLSNDCSQVAGGSLCESAEAAVPALKAQVFFDPRGQSILDNTLSVNGQPITCRAANPQGVPITQCPSDGGTSANAGELQSNASYPIFGESLGRYSCTFLCDTRMPPEQVLQLSCAYNCPPQTPSEPRSSYSCQPDPEARSHNILVTMERE